MLRPLRIEFPDACYHVICRGIADPMKEAAARAVLGSERFTDPH